MPIINNILFNEKDEMRREKKNVLIRRMKQIVKEYVVRLQS